MHLHDLFEKGHRGLTVSEGISADSRTVDDDIVLGLSMPVQRLCKVRLASASEFPHLAGHEDPGFTALAEGTETVRLVARFEQAQGAVERCTTLHPGALQRVLLPNVLDLPSPFSPADLVFECSTGRHPVFLGSSGRAPRDALYRLARGRGVEIGPGPRPQILSSTGTEVTYVEEMPAEDWIRLYKPDAASDAWQRPGYVIGKAHELPVDDESLDFIFSSHVFEHLFNPLGHLVHWRRKLKPGGLVLGVVPSTEGTKDFRRAPAAMPRLLSELAGGEYSLPVEAYERWVRAMQPRCRDPRAEAERLHRERVSIHVHVYDHAAVAQVFRHAIAHLGYAAYRLFYKRNAKDFVFALKADDSVVSAAAGTAKAASSTIDR